MKKIIDKTMNRKGFKESIRRDMIAIGNAFVKKKTKKKG